MHSSGLIHWLEATVNSPLRNEEVYISKALLMKGLE